MYEISLENRRRLEYVIDEAGKWDVIKTFKRIDKECTKIRSVRSSIV